MPTGADFGPFAFLERFRPLLAEAFGVDLNVAVLEHGQVSKPYEDVYRRLQDSRAYELRTLTGTHTLTGSLTGTDPVGDVAALLAATPAALAAQTRGDERHTSLLALLARQARLVTLRDAALGILIAEGLATEKEIVQAGSSSNFVVASLSNPATLTPWTYLLATLRELGQQQGPQISGSSLATYLQQGQLALADFLTSGGATGVAGYRGGAYAAVEQIWSQRTLGPGRARGASGRTARAARDGASRPREPPARRLDHRPCRTGASTRCARRSPTGALHRRLRLGRGPAARAGHPLAPDVPAALADATHPIYADEQSEGFIHAPSINHAVTAAILREGLRLAARARATSRIGWRSTSRRGARVSQLDLIDGVRAGNSLGALLGLSTRALPARLPRGNRHHARCGRRPAAPGLPVGGDGRPTSNSHAAAQAVCDGLAIADTVVGWIETQRLVALGGPHRLRRPQLLAVLRLPVGAGLGAAPARREPATLDGVVRAIDHVADALDALGDIVVAEGVHQTRARQPRARRGGPLGARRGEGATGSGSRRDSAHRYADHASGPAAACRRGGPTGRLEGDPGDTAGGRGAGAERVGSRPARSPRRHPAAGRRGGIGAAGPRGDGGRPRPPCARPRSNPRTGARDGPRRDRRPDARRVPPGRPRRRRASGRAAGRHHEPRFQLGADHRTLAEIAPLLEAIGVVLGRARPADSHDWVLADQAPGGSGAGRRRGRALRAHRGAPRRRCRLSPSTCCALSRATRPSTSTRFRRTGVRISTRSRHPDPPRWADRDTWRAALMRAAAFGIPAALPPASYQTRVQVRRAIRVAAETAFVEIVQRLARAASALSGTSSPRSALARRGRRDLRNRVHDRPTRGAPEPGGHCGGPRRRHRRGDADRRLVGGRRRGPGGLRRPGRPFRARRRPRGGRAHRGGGAAPALRRRDVAG